MARFVELWTTEHISHRLSERRASLTFMSSTMNDSASLVLHENAYRSPFSKVLGVLPHDVIAGHGAVANPETERRGCSRQRLADGSLALRSGSESDSFVLCRRQSTCSEAASSAPFPAHIRRGPAEEGKLGRHFLSNAACLTRPNLFSTAYLSIRLMKFAAFFVTVEENLR